MDRFDEIIDRRGTHSLKYDFAQERGKPEGNLPLWVADMDFQTPPEVRDALAASARHGIFGYSESKQGYFDALQHWFSTRLDWNIQQEWLVKTPGVVYAIACAIRALTREGDGVLVQKPVYYPFSDVILANNRRLVNNPLEYREGHYQIDFHDFEKKIAGNGVKLFILCSPHNPVGRVWTEEELARMGDICLKHGVVVVSDEIHADFVYPGHRHIVFSRVKPEFLQKAIVCTAPSKTFNLAGLQVSNIFIPDVGLRRAFRCEVERTGYSQLNTMGLVACQAAYEHGAAWLDDLIRYLKGNLDYLKDFLIKHIPDVKLVEPQGTYLAWLDFRGLGLDWKALEHLIVHQAGLWLDDGLLFGTEGIGFQRMNIACPRALLKQALSQLDAAVQVGCVPPTD